MSRVHLVLVGVGLFVALVGLVATGQVRFGAPESVKAQADTATLETISATWGDNCNDYIASLGEDASPNSGAMSPIKRDNVLRRVATICDAKKACAFPVNTEMLGADPAPGCTKALTVEYRCSDSGASAQAVAYSGSEMSIDCHPAAASAE